MAICLPIPREAPTTRAICFGGVVLDISMVESLGEVGVAQLII